MRANVPHTLGLTLLVLIGFGGFPPCSALGALVSAGLSNSVVLAEQNLAAARKRAAAESTNSAAACELGVACFTSATLITDRGLQEKLYTEGVTACRRSLALDPKSAAAHYYLGMNIGRVADLKRNLTAFGMVKEVEREFQLALKLDEKLAQAGPDRNLGLLYRHAPGWPISVGNEKLARQHLERAVKLAPDYPENRLNLAEAYLAWRDHALFRQELQAVQKLWPVAKTNLNGVKWEADWIDWEQRRAALVSAAKAK